jgi:hypothetical protein
MVGLRVVETAQLRVGCSAGLKADLMVVEMARSMVGCWDDLKGDSRGFGTLRVLEMV